MKIAAVECNACFGRPGGRGAGFASRSGFSMTEMITAIAIIGVMSSIVVLSMTGTVTGAKEGVAVDRMEMLNQGLNSYAQAYKEYTYPPNDSAFTDENTVINDLEYRNADPNKALIGSPFVRPNYRPSYSGSNKDYRLMWTGSRFKLLRPGTDGFGAKVSFDGSDIGTPLVYPPNYSSSGR